ncbi:MAG: hypothetical protein B6D56_01420 [Candidatus Omnitrophica bacterium 4484_70.1]|nr:MAG: hypothetical protein B6D56_01420 [Candidatus Omnitrophica bacterium 4484_70.1]
MQRRILRKIYRVIPGFLSRRIVKRGKFIFMPKIGGYIIFGYHSFSVSYNYNINIYDFEQQIIYLKKFFRIISLSEMVENILNKCTFDKPVVSITFDDGYKDNREIALPLLLKYKIPATFFISPGIINCNYRSFLSWNDIKEMTNNDLVEFGSHGYLHQELTPLKEEDIIKEVCRSKQELENFLGKSINFFSYPYGIFNSEIKKIVQMCGYKAALSAGINQKHDIFSLNRVMITSYNSSLDKFAYVVAASITEIK